MAAHSYLEVAGRALWFARESYDEVVASMFLESDLAVGDDVYAYSTSAERMDDRLRAMGFTTASADRALHAAVKTWHAEHEDRTYPEVPIPMMSADDIKADLASYLHSTDPWATYSEPQAVVWRLDAREWLRLTVDAVSPEADVALNLKEVIDYGGVTGGQPFCDMARTEQRARVPRDTPLIVLTEGSSDARTLALALDVFYPHLYEFVRFMDFQASNAAGGAASLVQAVRAFVAAGIANRVVALADNDTAGRDALQDLLKTTLPSNFRVLVLPDVESLRAYPTLGPQASGTVPVDVNGLAGCLEMYLGPALRDQSGDRFPVQWEGFVRRQGQYQGSLSGSDKLAVQAALKVHLGKVRDGPAADREAWADLIGVLEAVLHAFD